MPTTDRKSKMKKTVVYVHGKGGNADDAKRYTELFQDADVIGFDYKSSFPWDAEEEFRSYFDALSEHYSSITLVAESLGAYFTLNSFSGEEFDKVILISPVVDMEKLICDMMTWSDVSENELREKGEIETVFGETLSYEYLTYVRKHPVKWKKGSHIVYGSLDNLTSLDTVTAFANKTDSTLSVIEGAEHWFHTPEQMTSLLESIKKSLK